MSSFGWSRALTALLATVTACLVLPLQAEQDPSAVLQLAREAIGGRAAASVQSLRLVGNASRRNQMYRPGAPPATRPYVSVPFTMIALFPDYYRATRTMLPAGRELTIAFHGERALTPARVTNERVEFVRLMLATLLKTDSVIPLKLDADRSRRQTLAFTGADNFLAFVDIDGSSNLPKALRFMITIQNGPSASEKRDMTWVLEDRRMVAGLSFPHRIVKRSAETIEETFQITLTDLNPQLKPADFMEKSPADDRAVGPQHEAR